jgi:ribosomal protein S18 acetylase RimI-like enzyme
VFRDSWQLAYRGIIPHLHLETMIRRRGPEWWASAMRGGETLLVLEVAGTIAGYATCGPARGRGRMRNRGEIYELYLSPEHQGLGFGEHLFEACRHVLDMRRLDGLVVWALAENAAAIDFYWRRGGRPVAKSVDTIGGARLEKLGFTWS